MPGGAWVGRPDGFTTATTPLAAATRWMIPIVQVPPPQRMRTAIEGFPPGVLGSNVGGMAFLLRPDSVSDAAATIRIPQMQMRTDERAEGVRP
ncbi:hypothetical protein EBR04_11205 [bacterium]|nr:hypothetical protein [bacterium]